MEYKDNITQEGLHLQSSEWVIKVTTQLLEEYHACKTEHEKNKLRPRMEYMRSKLAFEEKELEKLLKQSGYEEA